MIGIYKITNLKNGKAYIGQSTNIEKRIKGHKKRAYNASGKEYEKTLYRAIRKYGLNNFKFEVLEICCLDELNEKERYYIEKYNTYYAGYNETFGGDNVCGPLYDEHHPKTKLTNSDVFYIRECYNNHQLQEDVYQEFSDRIGKSGFKKIWNGTTWTDIHMDVYTQDNKDFFNYFRNSKSSKNTFTLEEVVKVRTELANGKKWEDIYQQQYSHIDKQIFRNMCFNKTYKHVKI